MGVCMQMHTCMYVVMCSWTVWRFTLAPTSCFSALTSARACESIVDSSRKRRLLPRASHAYLFGSTIPTARRLPSYMCIYMSMCPCPLLADSYGYASARTGNFTEVISFRSLACSAISDMAHFAATYRFILSCFFVALEEMGSFSLSPLGVTECTCSRRRQ